MLRCYSQLVSTSVAAVELLTQHSHPVESLYALALFCSFYLYYIRSDGSVKRPRLESTCYDVYSRFVFALLLS